MFVPLLNVVDGNVEPAFEVNLRSVFLSGGVPAGEVDHNLADVGVLHHHSEETDDHLGARPAENLNLI